MAGEANNHFIIANCFRLLRFMVGILESPLRVGEPFDIPLDMQDKFGHSTPASDDLLPVLESRSVKSIVAFILHCNALLTQSSQMFIKVCDKIIFCGDWNIS